MKLLVITTSFPVDELEISGPFILRLVENLPQWIHPVVITPGSDDAPLSTPHSSFQLHCFSYAPRKWQVLAHRPGGIPVALKEKRERFLLLPGFLLSMLHACLRHSREAHLIHAHWSVCGVLAAAAARIRKIPVVTTLRGEDVTRARNRLLYRLLLRGCMKWSRTVVTVSRAIENEVKAANPRWAARVVTIPNGVDRAHLRIPHKEGIGEGGVVRFGVVGSLIPRKDVHTIVEAFKALDGGEDAELVLIGDGPERQALERLAVTRGIGDRVRFLGKVSPRDIPDQLGRLDVLVLGSRSEGRPNAVLEGMAAGLPVIATDIDGVRELVFSGVNGFLFKPGDVRRLSDCMRYILEHPSERYAMGRASRKVILDQGLFWDSATSKYAQIYQELLKPMISRR